MTIERDQITGLVLAGGRGSRMGGVDKGLQNHRGVPLALHALLRLQPQVGEVMINANRNLGAYESMGVPVWPDVQSDFPGPLAGVLVGLERCETPYLVTVPCDTPNFPLDLVERLAQALVAEQADIAMAATRENGEVMRAAGVLPAEARACWRAWSSTCTRASARSTAGPRCIAWRPWCSTMHRRSTTPTPSKSCSACSKKTADPSRRCTSGVQPGR